MGVVDVLETEENLLSAAQQVVEPFTGKNKIAVAALKRELYNTYYSGLTLPEPKL
jgi:hypothetical protein